MPPGTTSAAPAPIGVLFDDAVRRAGDAPALRVGDEAVTYRELAVIVDHVEATLAERGVGRGSRIALSAGNSVEFVAVVFAAARLGAVIVMVSTAWREREVVHAFDLTAPTHVVHDGSGATALDELFADRPQIRVEELLASEPQPSDATGQRALDHGPVDLDDLAVMVFSSGTTGLPKAVRHSHRSVFHATVHWIEGLGLSADDRLQIATPPFHILGLLNIYAVVAAGASVRLHRRFDLDTVLRSIGRDGVTIEMAVAPIALAMASHPGLEQFDLSSLRYIMWGATPVTASVADTVTRRTGVRFLAAYGASELPVIAVNPVDRPDTWRLDSVGVPPTGVELAVRDLATGAVLPPGRTGEIIGRGPSLMLGYLPDDATAEVFVDGWYRTGDVGAIDAAGWVTITDRVKEMIKVNGFQVAPAEIESVLLAEPGVVDCAVFGVPDAATGEAVIAAVVLDARASVTADELRSRASDQLASYKKIRELTVIDQIPRLPSGKVLRRELAANHGS